MNVEVVLMRTKLNFLDLLGFNGVFGKIPRFLVTLYSFRRFGGLFRRLMRF